MDAIVLINHSRSRALYGSEIYINLLSLTSSEDKSRFTYYPVEIFTVCI